MASPTDIGELRKLRVVDLREKLTGLRLPTGGRRQVRNYIYLIYCEHFVRKSEQSALFHTLENRFLEQQSTTTTVVFAFINLAFMGLSLVVRAGNYW